MKTSIFIQILWGTVCVALSTQSALAQIETVRAEGREYRESMDLQGATVHGFQVTEIRAKLGGYVRSIGRVNDLDIDVGSFVSKGDLLAVLDIPEMKDDLAEKLAMVQQAKSEVVQAEAAVAESEAAVLQSRAALDQVKARTAEKQAMLKLSETKMRRVSRLASNGTIGKDNLDEARFNVDVARASLASVEADIRSAEANIKAAESAVRKANADLEASRARVQVSEAAAQHVKTLMQYSEIRAPYDGVITRRLVDHGSFVQPAENNSAAMPIFELTQVSKVRLLVAVPNNRISHIAVGQEVVFDSIGGLEGRAFSGKVTRTAGVLDLKTRTMRIEVHLENPVTDTISGEQVELKPGLFGTMTVIRKQWAGDDLLPVVPTTAVGKDGSGNHFVVVLQDNEPIRRRVTLAFNDAAVVGISSGLKVGESVVKSGVNRY